jgi:hypothetical protein
MEISFFGLAIPKLVVGFGKSEKSSSSSSSIGANFGFIEQPATYDGILGPNVTVPRWAGEFVENFSETKLVFLDPSILVDS